MSTAFNEPLYAREFLINEVLAAQAADVQTVLLRASVPSQICGPLLDALCGDVAVLDEGIDRLETVVRANVFLMPADGGRNLVSVSSSFPGSLTSQAEVRLERHYP